MDQAWRVAVRLVETLEAPAALLDESCQQLHLNVAAKAVGLEACQFAHLVSAAVQPAARLDGAVCVRERSASLGRWSASLSVPVRIDGRRFLLCVPSLCLRLAAGPVRMADRPPILDQLAPRYARVAELLLLGLSDKEIAAQLALSYNTVRTYVRVVLKRAGVHSRAEFICTARPSDPELAG